MIASRFTAIAAAFLVVATTATAQAPANNDCVNAAAVGLGVTPFDSTMATDSGTLLDPASCFGTNNIFQDLWFTFTPGTTDAFVIETQNNGNPNFDTKMAVYGVTTCPAMGIDVLDCDDDDGVGLYSKVTLALTAGVPVLIRVGSFSAITTEQPAALIISVLVTPANDNCVNAAVASVGSNLFDSSNALTDGLPLDPLVCDMSTSTNEQVNNDVWFTFTSPTTDSYVFDTSVRTGGGGSSFNTRLAIYDQTTCPDDPALVLGCDDDQILPTDVDASATAALTMGQTVRIRVGSQSTTVGFGGTGDLFIGIAPPPPTPPANDDCGNAMVVGVGSNLYDSSFASTDGSNLDPLVCDMSTSTNEQISNDIWFTFTAPTTDFYIFDTSTVSGGGGSAFDNRLAVYDQVTCPDDPALVLGCDDDQASPFNLDASVTVSLTLGQTVTVRLGSFSTTPGFGGTGDLFIGVAPPPPTPPANDDCVNAEVITAFGTYAWDNTLATTDGADLAGFCDIGAFGNDIVMKDVWFEYTPTVGGCTYISHLGLAGFDTRIAVYNSSTCPDDPATVIGCSDEEVQPIASPFEAGLDIVLSAGNTYLIRVGNFSTSTTVGGPAMMLIAAGPQAFANDGGMQTGSAGCPPAPPFPEGCNGDGGDQMGCTDCPCGNNSPIGTIGGCLNSALTSSRLLPSGDTSVSLPSGDTSDLRFGLSGAPATAFCILNSGDNVAPQGMANPCFGLNSGAQSATFDGLRCAVQNTLRHGGRSADVNGDVGVTNNPWGGEGGPPVGLAVAGAGFTAGQTRYFQVIHRDDPLAICGRGLNTTQSVEVMFTP